MSQFYAEVQGNRGAASRMGTKASGMWAHVRGWHVGVRVSCWHDSATGEDVIEIRKTGGSSGADQNEPLATIRGRG